VDERKPLPNSVRRAYDLPLPPIHPRIVGKARSDGTIVPTTLANASAAAGGRPNAVGMRST
jgi:hypothetical protein